MNNNEVASYGQTRFKTILRKIKNDEEVSEEDRQYVTIDNIRLQSSNYHSNEIIITMCNIQ